MLQVSYMEFTLLCFHAPVKYTAYIWIYLSGERARQRVLIKTCHKPFTIISNASQDKQVT